MAIHFLRANLYFKLTSYIHTFFFFNFFPPLDTGSDITFLNVPHLLIHACYCLNLYSIDKCNVIKYLNKKVLKFVFKQLFTSLNSILCLGFLLKKFN